MKSFLNSAKQYTGGLNGMLAVIYFFFSSLIAVIAKKDFSIVYLVLSSAIIAVIAFLICPLFIRFLSGRTIACQSAQKNKNTNQVIFRAALFTAPLAILMFYYSAYYPGAFSPDSLGQYEQAVTGSYVDWHPVIHTLLFFTVPLKLTGGWTGSVVLFQILAFSAALGYSLNVILSLAGPRWALISAAFILFNPQLAIVMYPWKDIAFAIGAVLLTTYSLQILMTKGEWIRNTFHTALFITASAFTTLVRHNAILFTLPLVIAIFLFTSKKRGLVILLCTAVAVVAIKIPLYSAIGVMKPGNRQSEMLGIPMNVIGAVAVYDPESLDQETAEFVSLVSPREVWEEKFRYGSFDEVKFDERTDIHIIEEYGAERVLSMMLGCIRSSPGISAKAVAALLEVSFSFTDSYDEFLPVWLSDNTYGISAGHPGPATAVCDAYRDFVSACFSYPFLHLGFLHLILVFSILAKCDLSARSDWKKILLITPVFLYNWATTLLLMSIEDASRFFYYTYLIVPLLLVILFQKGDRPSQQNKHPGEQETFSDAGQ